MSKALFAAGLRDPDLARALRVDRRPSRHARRGASARPACVDRVVALGMGAPQYPLPGPTRGRTARRDRLTTRESDAMNIDLDDVTLHVRDTGAGVPVVLLHGWPDTGDLWRHQVPALTAAGYRVIAPDLRGFGASEQADRPGRVRRAGAWSAT